MELIEIYFRFDLIPMENSDRSPRNYLTKSDKKIGIQTVVKFEGMFKQEKQQTECVHSS
jgi:hypothetical protein